MHTYAPLHLILIILFIVFEGLAMVTIPLPPRYNLVAAGLFCFGLSLLF